MPESDVTRVTDTEWVIWVAEALSRGCAQSEIIHELTLQGHPDPLRFIQQVREHPLFEWGSNRSKQVVQDKRRLELFHRLQSLLDQRDRPDPIQVERIKPQLFEQFYRVNRPCVLTQWADSWQAFKKPWSAERLGSEFASVSIEVTEGREGRADFDRNAHLLKRQTSLGTFAQRVIECREPSNDFYLIARNFALDHPLLLELLEEIDESPFLDPKRRSKHVALWFGPQGTYTPLHHDTCNIMFVQMWGEKRIDLLPPYRQDLFETSHNMYASLDLRASPQPEQRTVILKPGEALFIPVGWWHQVEALSASTSLAMTHFHLNNHYQWYQPGRAVTPSDISADSSR